jgi:hypothetical protein
LLAAFEVLQSTTTGFGADPAPFDTQKRYLHVAQKENLVISRVRHIFNPAILYRRLEELGVAIENSAVGIKLPSGQNSGRTRSL